MNSLMNYMVKLPQQTQAAICVALSALVCIVDYITGDYGITLAYLLPIYITAKLLGRRACIFITVICIVEMTGLTLITRPVYETYFDMIFWNAILQSAELGITGYLISLLTSKLCLPIQKQ